MNSDIRIVAYAPSIEEILERRFRRSRETSFPHTFLTLGFVHGLPSTSLCFQEKCRVDILSTIHAPFILRNLTFKPGSFSSMTAQLYAAETHIVCHGWVFCQDLDREESQGGLPFKVDRLQVRAGSHQSFDGRLIAVGNCQYQGSVVNLADYIYVCPASDQERDDVPIAAIC